MMSAIAATELTPNPTKLDGTMPMRGAWVAIGLSLLTIVAATYVARRNRG